MEDQLEEKSEVCPMAFSPADSPVYGGGTMILVLSEDTTIAEDAEVFLVYEGSTERHTTTTTLIREANTIQATIPGHNTEEEVNLIVYIHSQDDQYILGSRKFHYLYDTAHYITEFLVSSVENPNSLDDLELIQSDKFDLSNEIPSTLDNRLTASFEHFDIPDSWNLFGTSYDDQEDPEPRETVLHFAARLGLTKLARFLLDKPGCEVAVQLPNQHGDLPKDIARSFGMDGLAELLSEYNGHSMMTGLPSTSNKVCTKNSIIHCYDDGMATITSKINENNNRSIEEDIAMLHNMTVEEIKKPKIPPTVSWLDQAPQSDNIILDGDFEEDTDNDEDVVNEEGDDSFPDDHQFGNHDQGYTATQHEDQVMSGHHSAPSTGMYRAEERKQILEANIQKLHDINEGIQRLQRSSMRQNIEENERRDGLARFSTSCPTLDRSSPPLVEHVKQDFFKSMMHIPVPEDYEHEADEEDDDLRIPDAAEESADMEYTSDYMDETHDTHVAIKINDVTMSDSSTDLNSPASTVSHLTMGLRRNLREKDLFDEIRRRSWHTNSTPDGPGRMSRHLAAAGKCFSLSSLDSTEEVVEDVSSGSQSEMMHVGAGADGRDSPITSLTSEPSARSTPLDQGSPNYRSDTSASIRSASDIGLDLDTSNENEGLEGERGHQRSLTSSGSSPGFQQTRLTNSVMTKSVSTPQISKFKEDNKENDAQSKMFSQSGHVNRRHQQVIQEEPRSSQHPTNFQNDDDRPKHNSKEENKRRRVSMFSKFGSYRQKKKEKEMSKARSSHSYVSVSFSNSRQCDACGKSMANKQALQCENCSVSVHDSSCRDQVAACTKFRHARLIQRPQPIAGREKVLSLPTTRNTQQQGSTSGVVPGGSSSGSVLPSRVIDEMEEMDVNKTDIHSNIIDTYSVSTESLDDGAGVTQFEDDPDLVIKGPEAEAWSVTVDKKTIKNLKLSSKDVKRQDHIWELVQTEKHYFRILKVMQKIFADGMNKELLMSRDTINRIFPQLDELLDIHQTFLDKLKERQERRPDKYVENISDILLELYGGNMGDRMKKAYGEFCSHHKEAVAFYKDLFKSDRKFQNFIKKCSMNSLCKRMGVTECILFVTQRLTKYPPLIEAIIKPMKESTKETRQEKDCLRQAVALTQHILKHVDEQIHARDRELRLIEIYNRLDARSSTKYRKRDFKKSNLITANRKLIKEGMIGFKTARGKEVEVLMVLLTDVVLFLEDNGQKYTFLSQDKKSGAVPLFKLIARENGSRRDKRSMYLITQLQDSYDMYEIVCKSKFECDIWIVTFRDAIMKCPDEEDEGVPDEGEEERKMAEAKFAKLHELVGHLKRKDEAIQQCCEERFKVILDMCDIHGYHDILKGLKSIYKTSEGVGEVLDPRDLLQAVVQEATRLAYLIQSNCSINLSRSASSAGEHDSGLNIPPDLPKRADTFTGFDHITNGAISRAGSTKKRNLPELPGEGQDGRSGSLQNLRQESDSEALPSPDGLDRVREHSRISRRPSIIHTLTNLMGKEETESRPSSDKSSDRGSGYFMEMSAGSSLQSLVPPSREQAESLAQLNKYLHDLLTFATRQSTQGDSLRIQLAQALDRAERFKANAQKSNLERKSTFRHNLQLEELRNLQEDVSSDRKKWEKEKAKEKQRLEAESAEIDLKQKEIAKELEELRSQKEELQRQREAFQRQIDFFQESMATQRQQIETSNEVLDSSVVDIVDAPLSKSSPKIKHKRSASDDWSKFNDGDPFEPMDVQYSKSLKEPLNKDRVDLGQGRAFSTGSTGNLLDLAITSPNYGSKRRESRDSNNTSLPEHLCSATNEVKSSAVQQKIPVKLSSLASSSSLKSIGNTKKDKGSGHSNLPSNTNNNSMVQESPSSRPSRSSMSMKPIKSSGNILPFKLAESGSKKRSDSPSTHSKSHVTMDSAKGSPRNQRREMSPSNDRESKQQQTQPEQKVIYF